MVNFRAKRISKNERRYLFFVVLLLVAGCVHQPRIAFAASEQGSLPTNGVVVADVSIYNPTVSGGGDTATVKFSLSNGVGAQPDVRYGLIISPIGSSTQQQDEYIAPETISLSENQTVDKTIVYTAPQYLSGAFVVWVEAKTSSGMPLATVMAGEVGFNANTQSYVSLLSPTCYLTVDGEQGNIQYVPDEGVDILPTESLTAHCSVSNHLASTQNLTPHVAIHYRTEFGDTVPVPKDEAAPISFTQKRDRSIDFALPKPQSPQSYEALVTLVDASGKSVSNTVMFHYVIDGTSATIQNAVLDKDYYAKGDTAQASLNWTPSADSFVGSRHGSSATSTGVLSLEVSLSDGSGQACAETATQQVEPTAGINFVVPMRVKADCNNPSVSVVLVDGGGTRLASKTYSIMTVNRPTSFRASLWIEVALGFLVLIGAGYGLYSARRKSSTDIPAQSN